MLFEGKTKKKKKKLIFCLGIFCSLFFLSFIKSSDQAGGLEGGQPLLWQPAALPPICNPLPANSSDLLCEVAAATDWLAG